MKGAREAFRRGARWAPPSRLWQGAHVLPLLLLASSARAGTTSSGWNEDEAALAKDPVPGPPAPPPPPPPPRTPTEKLVAAPLVFDAELRGSIGWASMSRFVPNDEYLFGGGDEHSLADLTWGGFDLSLALGTFVKGHWKLGYEATGGLRSVRSSRATTGYRSGPNADGLVAPSQEALQHEAGYALPVGGYLAFYPFFSESGGLSLGVHLGGGLAWGAEYLGSKRSAGAVGAAADLGYDYAWSEHLACGVRVRYGWMGLKLSDDRTGESTSLGSDELSLALRLSAF